MPVVKKLVGRRPLRPIKNNKKNKKKEVRRRYQPGRRSEKMKG